jgi:hypothetical protein
MASFDREYGGSYCLKLRREVIQASEIKSETDGCDLIRKKNKGCRRVVRKGIVASLGSRYAARLECRRDIACLILLLLECHVSQ